MMRANERWPETFGFKIGGKAPVVIISVQDNSVAERAGIQPGDQILELNGENVQGLTKEQIVLLARRSTRVPPALAVISRIRTFELRRRRGRFGFTVRGGGPVFLHDVETRSPAFNVGMRSGDLVLKVNGVSVRHANADQVQQVIEACGPIISVVLIAGAVSIGEMEKKGKTGSSSSKYRRAREFYLQMNYYLPGDDGKKAKLIKALNRYARDRAIEQLCKALVSILQTPIERKILKEIRYLIPMKHKPVFDVMVGMNAEMKKPQRPVSALPFDSISRSSDDFDYMLGNSGARTWSSGSSMQSQYSNLVNQKRGMNADPPRSVQIKRGGAGAGFGFTLTGNAPVCVRSVDKNSPAAQARLKPGDHILEINGLNVRNKTHGHVIELLKGSGSHPTLLVQWRPMSALKNHSSASSISSRSVTFGDDGEPIRRPASALSRSSTIRTDQLITRSAGNSPQQVRALARDFKFHMTRLFTNGEQIYIKQCLIDYRRDRDVQKLLESIEPILDDPGKLQILHHMSNLLPENEQAAFDREAARLFSRHSDNGVAPNINAVDSDVIDVLYRVQGMKLSDVPRERNLIGGSALSNNAEDEWPSQGAASRDWEASGDLDMVPVRDHSRNGLSMNGDHSYDDDDELDLGLEELADALLEEDRKKAAAQVHTQAQVHGPGSRRPQKGSGEHGIIATTADEALATPESGLASSPGSLVGGSPGDSTGPSRDELQRDLETRKREVETYKKIVTDQQQQLSKSRPIEEGDAGSEPSKPNFTNDLASAVKARNKDDEEKDATQPTPPPPPPPPGGGGPPPPPPPPPPGLPAPPPPPGMPGIDGGDGGRMQLKRVNWEKLSGVGLENTVWAQLGRNERLDNVIEFMELEQNFSTIQKAAEKEAKKPEKPAVLNPKKAYNIAILLGHLKKTTEEIRDSIMRMDDSKLNEAHLRQLLMYAPDSTELLKYKYFADDVSKMDLADRFSYEMSKVPYYNQRLKAMLFRAQFDDKVDEVKPDLEAVIDACGELRTSDKLQKLLELVLMTGNYMNKGNQRIAGAQAFKISYLTKLNTTKTTDNKSTLLNFLVKKIEEKCPELIDIKDDLKTVPIAAKVSGQMLATEVQDLSRRMKGIKDDLISFQALASQREEDRFTEVVISIIEETEGKLEELQDLQKKMHEDFKDVVKFFGEKDNKNTTEDFFGIFAAFLVHFVAAVNQNTTKRKLQEEQAKREERSKLFKELKQRSMSQGEEGEKAKDELLKSLDARRPRLVRQTSENDDVFVRSPSNESTESPVKLESNNRWSQSSENESPKPVTPVSPREFFQRQDSAQSLSSSPPKPVKPVSKPLIPVKPAKPDKKISTPPPKPEKPVFQVPKKTTPPPKPEKPVKRETPPREELVISLPRRGSDSNNNTDEPVIGVKIFNESPRSTPEKYDYSNDRGHYEFVPGVGGATIDTSPGNFKNIMSAFQTNVKDDKPPVKDLYAKPDMSKKSPKPVKPKPMLKVKPEPAPPTPPRLYEEEDVPKSPYTDTGPPSFKPPPPPADPGPPTFKPLPPPADPGPPSFKPLPPLVVAAKLKASPKVRHGKNVEDKGPPKFTPPPPGQFSPHPLPALANTSLSLPPPSEFQSAALGNIEDVYAEVIPTRVPRLEEEPYSDVYDGKTELIQPYSSVDVANLPPSAPVDNDYDEVEVRRPKKPAPYKARQDNETNTGSHQDFGVPPMFLDQPDRELSSPSRVETLELSSPRFPRVTPYSPRLSSAAILTNDEESARERNNQSPVPPPRQSRAKPPPPPRTTSVRDEPETDINKLIAKALSEELKPEKELDDIPVRDGVNNTGVNTKSYSPEVNKPYLPPKPAVPANKPVASYPSKTSPPIKLSAALPQAFGASRNRSPSNGSTGYNPTGGWSYTGNNMPRGRSASRDWLGIEIVPPPPSDDLPGLYASTSSSPLRPLNLPSGFSDPVPPPPPSVPPPSLPPDDALGFDIPSPEDEIPGSLVNGFGLSNTASMSDEDDFTPPPPLPPGNKYGFPMGVPPPPMEFGEEQQLKPLVPPLRKHR